MLQLSYLDGQVYRQFLINKKVIKRVQNSRKLIIENFGECLPRSAGWRVSRRRGRIFSYLAAYMLGLACHIGDSSVAGNQLRSSRGLEFLAVRFQIYD